MRPAWALAAVLLFAGCDVVNNAGEPAPTPSASAIAAAVPCKPSQQRVPILMEYVNISSQQPKPAVYLADASGNVKNLTFLAPDNGATYGRFIDADDVVYESPVSGDPGIHINTLELRSGSQNVAFTVEGTVPSIAWSRDRSTVVYFRHSIDPATQFQNAELHLRRGTVDTVVATFGTILGRGLSADDEVTLNLSCDDHYLLALNTFVGTGNSSEQRFRVYRVDPAGLTQVFAPASGATIGSKGATMATWSKDSDRLYYRDGAGIQMWNATDGTTTLIQPGVRWFHPSTSPDGLRVAYDMEQDGITHVLVYNLLDKTTTPVGSPQRSTPWFIAGDTLAYSGLEKCEGPCVSSYQPNGKLYTLVLGQTEQLLNTPDTARITDVLNR